MVEQVTSGWNGLVVAAAGACCVWNEELMVADFGRGCAKIHT